MLFVWRYVLWDKGYVFIAEWIQRSVCCSFGGMGACILCSLEVWGHVIFFGEYVIFFGGMGVCWGIMGGMSYSLEVWEYIGGYVIFIGGMGGFGGITDVIFF